LIISWNLQHTCKLITLFLSMIILGCSAKPGNITPLPAIIANPTEQYRNEISELSIIREVIYHHNDSSIKLVDQNFQIVQSFESQNKTYYLTSDKCLLYSLSVGGYEMEGQVLITVSNLTGQKIKEYYALVQEEDIGKNSFEFAISPNLNWISYKVADGETGMSLTDSDIQNVKLVKISTEESAQSISLTNQGGARFGRHIWSPDSQYIVFTDFDLQGIPQIYIYNTELGFLEQITDMEEDIMSNRTLILAWSPESKHLVFSLGTKIGIAQISDKKIHWLDFIPNDIQNLRQIWWSDDMKLLVLANVHGESVSPALFWYDVSSNSVINKLSSADFGSLSPIYQSFPLDKHLNYIVAVVGDQIYTYDLYARTHKKIDTTVNMPFSPVLSPSNMSFSQICNTALGK
jgi:hypothetical protein